MTRVWQEGSHLNHMETGVPQWLSTRNVCSDSLNSLDMNHYYAEATDASVVIVWQECSHLCHMETGVPHRLSTRNVCLDSLNSLDMNNYYAEATDASIANV